MPLWRVFCTEGTYTSSEKQALSSAITKIYTTTSPARLPAFYVNVIFVESRPGNCFVGGTSQDQFVRFAGEHIARHMSPDEIARMHRFMDWLSQALKPFTNDKGLTWEAHIDQTPRELWRVGGLAPPPADSEAEALWRKMNAPVPYDHEGITPTYVGEKVNGTAVNGMMLARA